jgi:predicted nucleotidyltransferase
MYGINERIYENLVKYFISNRDINKVILFGSRAKGNQRLNSDIDLCIDYKGKSKGIVVEDIDSLIGIYSCDIIFFDSLNEEIEKQINRYGVSIYEK